MTKTTHPNDQAFARHADGGGSTRTRATMEAHVAVCQACREELESYASIVEALRDPATWEHFDLPAGPPIEPDEEFNQRIEALAREFELLDARAEIVVDAIQQQSSNDWANFLKATNEPITGPLVARLVRAAFAALDMDPQRALEFARFAGSLCERLARPSLDLRGEAWKEEANALRYLGRLGEAHHALDQAEACFREGLVPEPGLAAARFARALVFWNGREFDAALECLRQAEPDLRRFGDRRRADGCGLMEAGILFEQGQYEPALRTATRLLARVEESDLELRAKVLTNIGHCEMQLGRPEGAAQRYFEALKIFEGLGLEAPRQTLRWSLADIDAAAGRFARALSLLDDAERGFHGLGMAGEAATVALRKAEILLAAGRPSEVPGVCRAAMDAFRRAGVEARVGEALGFLQAALDADTVTSPKIEAVRRFVEASATQPALLFVPPPS